MTNRDLITATADRLRGTTCVDAHANLLVLHHATNRSFDAFQNSADLGFHFGPRSQADKRRRIMISRSEAEPGDPWRVVSCVLAVRNPLVIADDPGVWGPRWLTATLHSFLNEDDRQAIRTLSAKLHAIVGQDSPIEAMALVRQWLDVLKSALKQAGHDGIVYRNVFENSGVKTEWSWLAFDDHQIVPLGDRSDLEVIEAPGIEVGTPPKLKGTDHPMRYHQERGMGDLVSKRNVKVFRAAVEEWGASIGVEWTQNVPLDFEPPFGTCRPYHDLMAKVGDERGFSISVRSVSGEIVLLPFSSSKRSDEMLADFRSDHSEGFFDQGLTNHDREVLHWRAAEGLTGFLERLDLLTADFRTAFLHEAPLLLESDDEAALVDLAAGPGL